MTTDTMTANAYAAGIDRAIAYAHAWADSSHPTALTPLADKLAREPAYVLAHTITELLLVEGVDASHVVALTRAIVCSKAQR